MVKQANSWTTTSTVTWRKNPITTSVTDSARTPTDLSYLLLTLALTVFAAAPLAYPGYVQVHSGFIPIYNLAELASASSIVGWTPSFASSFAPLHGDGLLSYYLALPLVWLGTSPLSGVKLVFASGFLLGACGVYLWLRRPLGPAGAALAAMVYTYLPYRLVVVYVRGAWGEALFLGLLPWGLVASASSREDKAAFRSHVLVALTWALLGLSHAGLAIWGFLLSVVWLLWVDRRGVPLGSPKSRTYIPLVAALIGLSVAIVLIFAVAGFSLPPSPINFFDHFLHPAQLFSAHWGFGASRPGWDDGLALGFGFAVVGLGMLTIFLILGRKHPNSSETSPDESQNAKRDLSDLRRANHYPLPLLVLALALTLLLLDPSASLWRLTGLHHTLAFPWQLLGLIGLCLSVMAGTAVKLDQRLTSLPTYAGLVILTLLASYAYLEPKFTQQPPNRPLATWDAHRLMLLDDELWVEIPPAAAGLRESTPGHLPLRDYGQPRPGDTLHLRLTWQATGPFYRDLKLFLHLLDGSGQMVAQVDPLAGAGAGPQEADYFTSYWDPGELIVDEVVITIPPDAPPGPYRLAFGLYDGDTLERLPVVGQEDARVVVEVGSRE